MRRKKHIKRQFNCLKQMVVPKLADSPEVSKKFATGHKIHDHIETTIVLQEIVGEHDEVMSSKQTQTDCPQYTSIQTLFVRTLKCASRCTKNGKSTACRIFFSLSVCSTCFRRTTCNKRRKGVRRGRLNYWSDWCGKRKKWTWQCSYLLFIENFHGKMPPGFRATFPLNEHHPAKRAGAERFDPLVIVEGGCVGARSVPFPFKVFLCFLKKLLNWKTKER